MVRQMSLNQIESCVGLVNPHVLWVPAFAGQVQEPTELVHAGWARVEFGAGQAWDKKFFVKVTECWLNTCESDMSKQINATESLWYKGVHIAWLLSS